MVITVQRVLCPSLPGLPLLRPPHLPQVPFIVGVAVQCLLRLPLEDLLARRGVLRQDDSRGLGGPDALRTKFKYELTAFIIKKHNTNNQEMHLWMHGPSPYMCGIPGSVWKPYLVAFKLGSRSSRSPSQSGLVSTGLPADLVGDSQQHESSVGLYNNAAGESSSITLISLATALLVLPRSLMHWGLTHWAKFQKGPSVPISPMRSAPRYMPGPLRASSAPCRCSGTSGWWPEPSRTTCRGGRGGHGQGTK